MNNLNTTASGSPITASYNTIYNHMLKMVDDWTNDKTNTDLYDAIVDSKRVLTNWKGSRAAQV